MAGLFGGMQRERDLVAGRPWNGERNEVPERDVSPSYFSTLGARLGHGRYFNEAENEPGKPSVAIVNQAFAKQYFPGENAVGKRISYALSKDSMEIVGVVEDIKEGELDTANRPILYRPFNQSMWARFNVIVRSSQAEGAILPSMRAAVLQIDARLATSNLATMEDLIRDSQPAYLHRASAWLVGSFAGLALVLGVVGLYGVIAYSVSQRSREIGVRMALGAQRGSVYRMILKDAGGLVAVGIAAGAAASMGATVLMRKMLFGVEPWDAATVVSVGALLGVAALLASYVPARRAASVNPVEALRAE
jgi:predicted permease